MSKTLKLISWNVNGLRAVLGKGFIDFVKKHNPDILCLQEVKAQPDQVDLDLESYHKYWNAAEKKGYSGVTVFSKEKPLQVATDFALDQQDREGRVLTAEYPNFYLVNVYTPNAQRELTRLDYRQKWDREFLHYVKTLDKKKPVIFCGDLNVAHKEIDLANPKSNTKNAGFTPEERAGFDRIVEAGFIDSFRHFCPDPGQYSWWTYRMNARERNVGWRIDYFCVSNKISDRMVEAKILPDVMGSDHCPVTLIIKN